MDINIGEEKIVELISPFTADTIQDRANAKRADAFGQLVKFMQRPKPEEVEIVASEKRYEPFWFGSARAFYKYDRRHRYTVSVAPEVRAATFYEQDHAVSSGQTFQFEAMEHCEEELKRELLLDPETGTETDFRKYLNFSKQDVENLQALQAEGAVVISPEIRSSFLVGKLTQLLMKTIQADKIFEQYIDVDRIILYYRPLYAFEFWWKPRDKRSVVELDALTGETRAAPGQIKKHLVRVLENDDLFDIGADVVGTFVPGANIGVKLGRLAARKALK